MNKSQKLKCLFGHHDYAIPHKKHPHILLCSRCRRFGHSKRPIEAWYEFDEKGNEIYRKSSTGFEVWYTCDDQGKLMHCKWSDGLEVWYEYDKEGNVVYSESSAGREMWYDKKGNVIKESDQQQTKT